MKRAESRRHPSAVGLALLIVIAAVPAVAQNKQQALAPGIAFTVSMPKPHTHAGG